MLPIKAWDIVVCRSSRNSNDVIHLNKVERVTKTLIILEWWTKAKKLNESIAFSDFRKYSVASKEDFAKVEEQKIDTIVNNWFYDKKFSLEEKKKIYELLLKEEWNNEWRVSNTFYQS